MSEWIEWNGGNMPIPECTKIKVRHRNGNEISTMAGSPSAIRWDHQKSDYDIVAYKILEPITPQLYGAIPDPKGHPNASILMEIAKEAAINPEYWKEFQWQIVDNDWADVQSESNLVNFMANETHIRRKPRTIRIGNYDVPEPMRFSQASSEYYMVNLPKGRFDKFLSFDSPADKVNINSGLCQETEEGAELMLKALQELLEVKK